VPSPDSPADTTPTAPGDVSREARRLLDQAAQAFADADAALRAGDPVEYARRIQAGRQLFDQARRAEAPTATATSPPDGG
jgi:uncharacterized protein